MSAFGTKRTSQECFAMSAFGGKADIIQTFSNVCYPKRAFSALFDHLVGGHEERLRSQIDDEIVFDCSTMGS
jgi:hypothetical protein